MFTVRLVNLPEVHSGHLHFLADNERMVSESLELAGKHSVEHVQRYPQFTPRTGKLQKGQKYRVIRIKSGRLLTQYNDTAYACPIDTGARPHEIHAGTASWTGDMPNQGYLRFYWKKKGRWVTTRSVRHPGNKPYKFGYRAWNSAGRVEEQQLRHRMTALAAKF